MSGKNTNKQVLGCNNCKYEWNYNGNSEYYATCPRCLRKVNVIKNSKRGSKNKNG